MNNFKRKVWEGFLSGAIFALVLWFPVFSLKFVDAATISANASGNWSNTSIWTGGVVPGDGDAAVLNGYSITANITTIPASGSLLSISDSGKTGQLVIPLNTLGNTTLRANTITGQSGNTTGTVSVTGSTGNTLTVYADLVGGAGTNSYAFVMGSTGTLVIHSVSSGITGGSGSGSSGLTITAAATVTINADVTGGTHRTSTGVLSNSSSNPTVTLNGNLVNSAGSMAWYGRPPSWTVGTYDVKFGSTYYGPEPLDHQLISGVSCGRISGNRVTAVPSQMLDTTWCGDPDSHTVGTYHAPDQTGVLSTTAYGVSSETYGTWVAPVVTGVLSTTTYGVSNGTQGTWVAPNPNTVWTGTTYGVSGGTSGTKVASSITNCSAVNIKKDVVVGDVTGSYDPMAAAVFPTVGNVLSTTGTYGPTGTEYTPTFNLSLYVLCSNVVDASYVLTGHYNYIGGSAGTATQGAGLAFFGGFQR